MVLLTVMESNLLPRDGGLLLFDFAFCLMNCSFTALFLAL